MQKAALLPGSLLLLSCAAIGQTPEWRGFRGNNGTGLAGGEALAGEFSMDAVAWRTEVPPGYSSPTVSGSSVFVTGVEDRTKLVTICLDRTSGEERWRRGIDFDGKRAGANSPAAPSPTTDGEHVYALFHAFGMIAYDFEGNEVWRAPMGPFNIPHGLSSSPIVHGDAVILLVDQDLGSYLVALDRGTGEERWKVERRDVMHGYTTPVLYTPDEGPAQVITSGSFQIAGYSVEDGEKLWWIDGMAFQAKGVPAIDGDVLYVNSYMPSASEIGLPKFSGTFEEALEERDADGDGLIGRKEWDHGMVQMAWFIFDLDDDNFLDARDWDYALAMERATGGLFAVQLGGRGDVTGTHMKWAYDKRKGLPHIPSPIVVGDVLFTIKEGGILTAFDTATGEVLKTGRVGDENDYFASPVAAGGRLLTASVEGQLAVISAEPEWEVVSLTELDETVWSTPAVVGDDVLVRSLDAVYCFRAPMSSGSSEAPEAPAAPESDAKD